jgi:hypothetical protein
VVRGQELSATQIGGLSSLAVGTHGKYRDKFYLITIWLHEDTAGDAWRCESPGEEEPLEVNEGDLWGRTERTLSLFLHLLATLPIAPFSLEAACQ